jgi:hypothetical protein
MNQMAASDGSEGKRRSKVLVSLQTYLALLFVAIVLVLVGLWWLGFGLENGKAISAVLLTLLFFGTLGEFVRQRFRVSLKGLLAAFTVLAILLGMLAQPLIEARKRALVAGRLQRLGADVDYDYRYAEGDWLTVEEGFIVPAWVRDLTGDDVLAHVRRVWFRNSPCRDADLADIDRLLSLEDLWINDSQITDQGIRHLAGLPNLKSITINGEQATEAALRSLGELPRLEEVTILGPPVTDAAVVHLKHLPRLRSLSLHHTTITDSGLRHLAAFKNLENLHLSDGQFGDAGIVHLKPLTSLRQVTFARTGVTDSGIMQLQDMRGLEYISFGGSVSDAAVDQLRAAMPQTDIRN